MSTSRSLGTTSMDTAILDYLERHPDELGLIQYEKARTNSTLRGIVLQWIAEETATKPTEPTKEDPSSPPIDPDPPADS